MFQVFTENLYLKIGLSPMGETLVKGSSSDVLGSTPSSGYLVFMFVEYDSEGQFYESASYVVFWFTII